jgi:transposase InsO family protein
VAGTFSFFAMRGVPQHIRSDNGPEFMAHALRRWLGQVGVDAMYIEPGSLRWTPIVGQSGALFKV